VVLVGFRFPNDPDRWAKACASISELSSTRNNTLPGPARIAKRQAPTSNDQPSVVILSDRSPWASETTTTCSMLASHCRKAAERALGDLGQLDVESFVRYRTFPAFLKRHSDRETRGHPAIDFFRPSKKGSDVHTHITSKKNYDDDADM